MSKLDKDHLVYLDESGVNVDMTRLYGRAKNGARVVDQVPVNTPKNMTVLSSIRLNGEKIHTCYPGGTTKERFLEYLKEHLLPTLQSGDIVVMDNMRSHHAKVVTEFLKEQGVQYVYLPAYSPDMNPIEKMWSKMKALLRKWKVRAIDMLPQAIAQALDAVSLDDCKG